MRAQASIEFLVYSVVFTIALVSAFVMISSLSFSHMTYAQRSVGLAIAERVANVFTLLSNAPEGTYYVIELPPTIGRVPYTLEVKRLRDGNFVEVAYGEESVLALFQGDVRLSCSPKGGDTLMLEKKDGFVEVVCR